MIRTFILDGGRLRSDADDAIPDNLPLWFDLHDPTSEEMRALESRLDIELPTKAEMAAGAVGPVSI